MLQHQGFILPQALQMPWPWNVVFFLLQRTSKLLQLQYLTTLGSALRPTYSCVQLNHSPSSQQYDCLQMKMRLCYFSCLIIFQQFPIAFRFYEKIPKYSFQIHLTGPLLFSLVSLFIPHFTCFQAFSHLQCGKQGSFNLSLKMRKIKLREDKQSSQVYGTNDLLVEIWAKFFRFHLQLIFPL